MYFKETSCVDQHFTTTVLKSCYCFSLNSSIRKFHIGSILYIFSSVKNIKDMIHDITL